MNKRILIAGTNWGCGKTTVTLSLLAALKARGTDVASFKCGPDFIDPMFHRQVLGIPARNLDPFFCTGQQLREQIASCGRDTAVLEGVMGYYDGIGPEGYASTADVARLTDTPVILTVNARGMYTSAGALIRGFRDFRKDSRIRGVIFDNISPALYEGLRKTAADAGVIPLGFLPADPEIALKSRYLGLVTAEEIPGLGEKIGKLSALAEKYLDVDGILAMASSAPDLEKPGPERPDPEKPETGERENRGQIPGRVKIAVARDRAFCFLYQENLEMLEKAGAQLLFFSPLADRRLPEQADGLYLPGGYPELFAEQLSGNTAMLSAVREAVKSGMPTIAECGGFLYLHDTLDSFPMAGVIRGSAGKREHLQHFGYVTLTSEKDTLLCGPGGKITAHEFHYYESTSPGSDYTAEKASGKSRYACVHADRSLYAGFPHLYFPGNPGAADSFIRRAREYGTERNT